MERTARIESSEKSLDHFPSDQQRFFFYKIAVRLTSLLATLALAYWLHMPHVPVS
jgi:hypothetical protein